MKIENILAAMTTEEKAALVSGTDFMYTNPIPRLHVPALRMSDGPHGLRVQKEAGDNGVTGSESATAFPTAVTTASGWNPENLRKMGEAIAEECKYYGVNILLGPGANIKRNPLCGRNFEYYSEDPLLAGKLAAAEIQGVQSQGVGVSMKHFALNNSENYRFMGGSIADLRVIHELYLRVFKIAVKEAHPVSIMCAYNKINGEYCCQNKWLLTDMLRTEWGFDGLVMTDWGATHNRLKMLAAGCDLEMPGDAAICRKWILDGVKSGALSAAELDKAAGNVLRLMERTAITKVASADWDKHHALAAEIAADCAVLLKNDGLLPLNKAEKVLVIGDLFDRMRYTSPSRAKELCKYELTQTLIDYRYSLLLNKQGYDINAHIKIDTGMHRLGFSTEDKDKILAAFSLKHIKVAGIFTHLCAADSLEENDVAFTNKQIGSFYKVLDWLKSSGLNIPKVHIQSSYGLLNYPELECDYIRVGVALYGVLSSTNDKAKLEIDLRPVLSLKAKVVLIRKIKQGESVGYSRAFTATRDSLIAILPIGYADGFPRNLSCGNSYALIGGRQAPIVGKICMDQLAVDVTDIPNVKTGSIATLIGKDGKEEITAPMVAESAESITNELLSRMGHRLNIIRRA